MMYCPNCQQEFDGKFCPECGTKLIDNSIGRGEIKLSLGDANAISGGIHVSKTTIVERKKSNTEIVLENENRYRALCRSVLADGKVDSEERRDLEALAADMNISPVRASEIFQNELQNSNSKVAGLDKISKVVFLQFVKKIQEFDLEGIVRLFPKITTIERSSSDETIKFYYYLVYSVLRRKECIIRYESHAEDCYWLTYWTVLAYILEGKESFAEETKIRLSFWPEYHEDNILLLEIAIAILHEDVDMALVFSDALEDRYSPILESLSQSEKLILSSGKTIPVMIQNTRKDQEFVLNGLFYTVIGRNHIGTLRPDGTLENEDDNRDVNSSFHLSEHSHVIGQKESLVCPITPQKDSYTGTPLENVFPLEGHLLESVIVSNEDSHVDFRIDRTGTYLPEKRRFLKDLWLNWRFPEFPSIYTTRSSYITPWKLGLIDLSSMTWVLPMAFDSFKRFEGFPNIILLTDSNKAVGLFDLESQTWLIPPDKYTIDAVYDLYPELLQIFRDHKMALFDLSKRAFITEFDYCYRAYVGEFVYNTIWLYKTKDMNSTDVYVHQIGRLFKNIYSIGEILTDDIYNLEIGDNDDESEDNKQTIVYSLISGFIVKADESYTVDGLEPYLILKRNEKFGVYDIHAGEQLIDFIYDDIDDDGTVNSPIFVLTKDGQRYYYNVLTKKFV